MLIGLLWIWAADNWLYKYYEWPTIVFYCVKVTNSGMSIMKNLLLYFMECNYDEWLYEYYEGSTVVFY